MYAPCNKAARSSNYLQLYRQDEVADLLRISALSLGHVLPVRFLAPLGNLDKFVYASRYFVAGALFLLTYALYAPCKNAPAPCLARIYEFLAPY